MSIAKAKREKKRQLGQYLTPRPVAQRLVSSLTFTRDDKVLEPSMGDGSFVIPIIERFLDLYDGSLRERLDQVLAQNVYGVEIDEAPYQRCLANIKAKWGYLPPKHNLVQGDFFRCHFLVRGGNGQSGLLGGYGATRFTHIMGNPPFGGTLDPEIEDELDKVYGFRNGEKIKKETYSFFIVKSLDLLSPDGRLIFICSDTFLTIKTMRGLRRLLMSQGKVDIKDLVTFSDETSHPMVVLDFTKNGYTDSVNVNGQRLDRGKIELTENFSWRVTEDLVKYFSGSVIGEYVVATSGMTIGKNEYFVREIRDGQIVEPYEFVFYDDPITLEKESTRARLGKIPARKIEEIKKQEAVGATRRNVRVLERSKPIEISLPHPDYCYYNKAISEIVYSPPTYAIYWKDDGDAVLTFKRNGNWYLHGVGGQRYFRREGLTWQLIAQSIHMRYLPPGYILDSGSPCAFLRPGVKKDELFFIMGWSLTRMCSYLLKEVINHTKNIQGKDLERLPYPFWVSELDKQEIISVVRQMVDRAMRGSRYTRQSPEIQWLEKRFAFVLPPQTQPTSTKAIQPTLPLFEPTAV